MPDYVCSGVRGGRREYDWSAGADADEAVAGFASRGFDDVRVHTDDVTALRPPAAGQAAWDAVSSDASTSWLGDLRAVAPVVLKALALMLGVYAAVVGATWVWDGGVTAGGVLIPTAGLFLAVGAFACFILFHPVWQVRAAAEDGSWGRWEGVLRRLPQVKALLAPDLAAAFEAQALAGLGELDDGLDLVDDHRDAVPEWVYRMRRAELFRVAGQPAHGVAEAMAAVGLAPDCPTALVDAAGFLTAPDRDPARALQFLARLRKHAHTEQIGRVADIWTGAALVSLNRPAEALDVLRAGVAGLRPYTRNNPVLGAIRDAGHAHLALALAATGDTDAAREHFALAESRLEARRSDELLARCDQALGPGGDRAND